MTNKYALIKNNKIIKFRNTKDEMLIDKLLNHGYLPVIEETPSCDWTQTVSDSYSIQKDVVKHIYTVQDLPIEEIRKIKIENTINTVIDDIRDLLTETDQGAKVAAVVDKKDQKITEIKAARTVQELKVIKDIELKSELNSKSELN